ncbi:MAG: MotA/TolQ/ExbB proton channel family protein [bacterium]
MLEIIESGGWLMAPLLLASAIAATIIVERFWSLRRKSVVPEGLAEQVTAWIRSGRVDTEHVKVLQKNSPLGEILASVILHREHSREVLKESVEDTGRHVAHDLSRFLNTLGTIAGVSPLLGLLGTVLGMIKVFATLLDNGIGDASLLAGGISQALITTAAGLTVAIPAFLFYRYFQGRVTNLILEMEKEALLLMDEVKPK